MSSTLAEWGVVKTRMKWELTIRKGLESRNERKLWIYGIQSDVQNRPTKVQNFRSTGSFSSTPFASVCLGFLTFSWVPLGLPWGFLGFPLGFSLGFPALPRFSLGSPAITSSKRITSVESSLDRLIRRPGRSGPIRTADRPWGSPWYPEICGHNGRSGEISMEINGRYGEIH